MKASFFSQKLSFVIYSNYVKKKGSSIKNVYTFRHNECLLFKLLSIHVYTIGLTFVT